MFVSIVPSHTKCAQGIRPLARTSPPWLSSSQPFPLMWSVAQLPFAEKLFAHIVEFDGLCTLYCMEEVSARLGWA